MVYLLFIMCSDILMSLLFKNYAYKAVCSESTEASRRPHLMPTCCRCTWSVHCNLVVKLVKPWLATQCCCALLNQTQTKNLPWSNFDPSKLVPQNTNNWSIICSHDGPGGLAQKNLTTFQRFPMKTLALCQVLLLHNATEVSSGGTKWLLNLSMDLQPKLCF